MRVLMLSYMCFLCGDAYADVDADVLDGRSVPRSDAIEPH